MYERPLTTTEIRADQALQDQYDAARLLLESDLLEGGAEYRKAILRPTDEQVATLAEEVHLSQDQIRASCTQESARLIREGAQIVNGVLRPTATQYDEIVAGAPREKPILGKMVLRGSIDDDETVDLEDILSADENMLQLRTKVAETLEPYAGLFDMYLPSAASNPRGFRGKLKNGPYDTHPSAKWAVNREMQHAIVSYGFSMDYAMGEDSNSIERVTATITSPTDSSTRGSMSFKYYKDYGLTSIFLNHTGYRPDEILYANTIGEDGMSDGKLDALLQLMPNSNELIIDIASECPCITLKGIYGLDCQYVYNAETAEFILKGEKTYDSGAKRRPVSLSIDDFTAIIKDTWAILPLKELKV